MCTKSDYQQSFQKHSVINWFSFEEEDRTIKSERSWVKSRANNLKKITCPFLKYVVAPTKLFKEHLSLLLFIMFSALKKDHEVAVWQNYTCLKKSFAVYLFLTVSINLCLNKIHIFIGITLWSQARNRNSFEDQLSVVGHFLPYIALQPCCPVIDGTHWPPWSVSMSISPGS